MTRAVRFYLAWFAMMLPVASAIASWGPTPAEMAALPPYCAARFNEGSDAFKTWRTSMGGDFIHIHHYCAGLNFLNRARGSFSSKNNGTLGGALREFDYVLTHASPTFYLRPEILMNRGIALSMMNRNGEAVSNLLKAIELDAKQPRAYMALADLYDKMKDRGKALDSVTNGLRHNPGTKSLQRRYTELGGKLPYPTPIAPEQVATPAVPPEEETAAPAVQVPVEQALVPPAPTSDAPTSSIGTPTNPYCRFCPD